MYQILVFPHPRSHSYTLCEEIFSLARNMTTNSFIRSSWKIIDNQQIEWIRDSETKIKQYAMKSKEKRASKRERGQEQERRQNVTQNPPERRNPNSVCVDAVYASHSK